MMLSKIFVIAGLLIGSVASAQGIDYNRLDSNQCRVAANAISHLCPANQQWFSSTCEKHPDGSFNPGWSKRMLLNKFSIKDIQQYGDLFTLMMAYERMMVTSSKKAKKNLKEEEKPVIAVSKKDVIVIDSTDTSVAKNMAYHLKKDTDRSTKEERALAVHIATLKLQSQLEEMKSSAKF